ncbi:MAG: FHA domain-containing protein [Candidatus Anammoximicrobium sp.]|nr:FHA domain-containing protein [Candidatus Anammoximicrobium sp.]
MAACFACESPIPDGVSQCPVCGLQLAVCRNPDCGQCYPAEASFCPFCGESVQDAAPAPVEPAAVEGPTGTGVVGSPVPFVAENGPSPEVFDPATGSPPGAEPAGKPASPGTFDQMLALFQEGEDAGPGPAAASAAADPYAPPAAASEKATLVGGLPAAFPADPSPGVPMIGLPGTGVADRGLAAMAMPGLGLPGLGVPTAAMSTAPVTLEVETSDKYRRHQQGLLRLRVRGDGLSSDALVDVGISSALFSGPTDFHVRLGFSQTHEFDALRFVPHVAGAEHVRISLTLKTPASVPLGRWSAAWLMQIEDVEKQEIHAGGDVFIVGGVPAASPSLGLDGFGAMGGWQPLPLQADPHFNRRLTNACPEAALGTPPPLDPGSVWPAGARAQAAVCVDDLQTGLSQALAVVCGNSANLGRGGDPAVSWWLQPSPFDAHQHGRLSRRHVSLELRDGRAWGSDWSTNGTWLNGERVAKSELQLLADEDRLEPAQVVPFHVTLLAREGQVHAIWLRRQDALREQLSYLLTDGQTPLPVLVPGQSAPVAWLAWRRTPNQGPELMACAAEAGRWEPLGPQQQRVLADRYRLSWQLLLAPVDQATYLGAICAQT